MQLLITEKELDNMISEGFIKPNIDNCSEFILTLSSIIGKTREIIVSTVDEYDDEKIEELKKKIPKSISYSPNGHSNIDEWIDSWRALWKGKRVKGMGSRDKCLDNMKEFFQLYPQYTQQQVFKARDRYFQSLMGDMTYLEQADYFIKKRIIGNDGGVEVRRTLLTYCEEIAIDETLGISDESFSIYEDL